MSVTVFCFAAPNSIAKCNVEPERDGVYAVSYVPVEVGIYTVLIKWNGQEIPGPAANKSYILYPFTQ